MGNDLPKGWDTGFLVDLPQVLPQIQQIKEKFGKLRVYWKPDTTLSKEVRDFLVVEWEARCAERCMVCGSPAELFRRTGWVGPICLEHKK